MLLPTPPAVLIHDPTVCLRRLKEFLRSACALPVEFENTTKMLATALHVVASFQGAIPWSGAVRAKPFYRTTPNSVATAVARSLDVTIRTQQVVKTPLKASKSSRAPLVAMGANRR